MKQQSLTTQLNRKSLTLSIGLQPKTTQPQHKQLNLQSRQILEDQKEFILKEQDLIIQRERHQNLHN